MLCDDSQSKLHTGCSKQRKKNFSFNLIIHKKIYHTIKTKDIMNYVKNKKKLLSFHCDKKQKPFGRAQSANFFLQICREGGVFGLFITLVPNIL